MLDEQFVQPGVIGEFRMERRHGTTSASYENRHIVVAGKYFDVGTHSFDQGCTDEHGVEGRIETIDVEVKEKTRS